MGKITMSHKQIKHHRLAMQVIDGKLTIVDFAIQINKSYRQAQRIIKNIKEKGVIGVLHGNSGKVPHNKTPLSLEHQIIDLLKYKYRDFNLTHFRERLESDEDIIIKKDALHTIASKQGLVKNPKRRGRRCHKPRPRLPNEGMMIQFDGSKHLWFGDTKTDLIAGIDDATGIVVAGEFFYGETSNHSLKVIREVVDNYGLPESFYMDQATMYGKVDREWESQISRAFDQTGIRLILAGSSQAKGRIERLWRTFQDRLIAELALYNIEDFDEANKYLKEVFIPTYNLKFSVKAECSDKSYRKNVFGDLDIIFCKKIRRKIMVGNVFSWDNITWIIDEKSCYYGREININVHLDGSYSFDIMGRKVVCRVSKKKKLTDYGDKSKIRKSA
ncbi:MAG: ISNCY family transposase [Bdellovibrionales bacterium]